MSANSRSVKLLKKEDSRGVCISAKGGGGLATRCAPSEPSRDLRTQARSPRSEARPRAPTPSQGAPPSFGTGRRYTSGRTRIGYAGRLAGTGAARRARCSPHARRVGPRFASRAPCTCRAARTDDSNSQRSGQRRRECPRAPPQTGAAAEPRARAVAIVQRPSGPAPQAEVKRGVARTAPRALRHRHREGPSV